MHYQAKTSCLLHHVTCHSFLEYRKKEGLKWLSVKDGYYLVLCQHAACWSSPATFSHLATTYAHSSHIQAYLSLSIHVKFRVDQLTQ